MSELWQILHDRRLSTLLVLSGVVVAGFALLAQAWRGAAATLFVPYQVPFVISGALLGVALVGLGLGLIVVHLERTVAALERRRVAEVQRGVVALLAHAPEARKRLRR